MAPILKPPFYVISDTHFYHRKIAKLAGRPYDHEVMMLKRWERTVKEHDTVLHLGDLFFGGWDGYERFKNEISPRLSGQKHIILGNHDKRKFDYEALGFKVIEPFYTVYRGWRVTFDHYPRFVKEDKTIHVHGHIHSHPYAHGEETRAANINVSVEVLDYRPHRVTRLLNAEIARHHGGRARYRNNKGYRQRRSRDVKRA
jgi:calcineurin-like phosphoesterase family protein